MSDSETLYQRLGGERGLKQFVDALYDVMDELPSVSRVRAMHPEDLSHARERLFMFLSGMLGGPPLYMEALGPPRMRRKHMHIKIGDKERDQWLICAALATDSMAITDEVGEELMGKLTVMANHLRNQGEQPQCRSLNNASVIRMDRMKSGQPCNL